MWQRGYTDTRGIRESKNQPLLPFPFISYLSLSVFVALPSSFNLPALLFAASSSSSLSFECHSTLPSYFNMLLLIKNPVPSPSKKDALPPHFIYFFLESTDADPSSLHFLHLWCTSPLTAQDFLTDSSWPVKVGGEVRKKRTRKRKKWRRDNTEKGGVRDGERHF